MKKNNVILSETQPRTELVRDELTNFMRLQAQKMLQIAIEKEVSDFMRLHQDKQLCNGHRQVVRNGYLPERSLQTGIGDIALKIPRVRDRGEGEHGVKFSSNLVPKYMRRTVSLDVLLPLLYLHGLSSNRFPSALEPLLGEQAKHLSPKVISRLKSQWYAEYE